MTKDTAQVIEMLDLQKGLVLGWSIGSQIALKLSLQFPEMVDDLILCSPNPDGKHQAGCTSHAHTQLTSPNLSQEQGFILNFPNTSEGRTASTAFADRFAQKIAQGVGSNDSNNSY